MFGYSGYAKPNHLKGGVEPRWQTYIPISIFAQIGREDKANCENTEEGRQVSLG